MSEAMEAIFSSRTFYAILAVGLLLGLLTAFAVTRMTDIDKVDAKVLWIASPIAVLVMWALGGAAIGAFYDFLDARID